MGMGLGRGRYRRFDRILFLIASLTLPGTAAAEVKSAGPNGFEVGASVSVSVTPARAIAAIGEPGRWWSKAHTYSGDAANMSLVLKPGGCFCERLPNGGVVEHARVVYIDPERAPATSARGGVWRRRGGGADGGMAVRQRRGGPSL